tara:strand:- start:892 stop:1122 length:231 start_codon:yes stop_codon:yes gene_type:complete
MKDPVNTFPIEKFIQQVKTADSSNQREVRLDIQTAKSITFTLAELLARLNGDLEELISKNNNTEEVISVILEGEKF